MILSDNVRLIVEFILTWKLRTLYKEKTTVLYEMKRSCDGEEYDEKEYEEVINR